MREILQVQLYFLGARIIRRDYKNENPYSEVEISFNPKKYSQPMNFLPILDLEFLNLYCTFSTMNVEKN